MPFFGVSPGSDRGDTTATANAFAPAANRQLVACFAGRGHEAASFWAARMVTDALCVSGTFRSAVLSLGTPIRPLSQYFFALAKFILTLNPKDREQLTWPVENTTKFDKHWQRAEAYPVKLGRFNVSASKSSECVKAYCSSSEYCLVLSQRTASPFRLHLDVNKHRLSGSALDVATSRHPGNPTELEPSVLGST
uniref:Uncharacterized protein n=1 Tax=Mycena chlorophos TaxID=658473 RepID=A0ABQ0LES0_MYCCL|nr:predicted protein [Mycena chlorophos]